MRLRVADGENLVGDITTPQAFLSAIGRASDTKISIDSWDSFWHTSGHDLKKAGVAVKDRRQIRSLVHGEVQATYTGGKVCTRATAKEEDTRTWAARARWQVDTVAASTVNQLDVCRWMNMNGVTRAWMAMAVQMNLDVTSVEGTTVGVTTKNKKRESIYSMPSPFISLISTTMASSLYRRQSMAQLYEKLRAQDDDDDLAWLAQYSPDDKSDDQYVSAPPPTLSTISSASPISSISSGSSLSDHASDSESSDGYFSLNSDSDVDPEPLELDLACTDCDPSPPLPLIFQSNDDSAVTEPSDPPEVPSIQERSPSPWRSSPPLAGSDASPVRSPSIAYYPTTRTTRKSSARRSSPAVIDEDGYAESDGDASEDEYVPSPAFGARKRRSSVRLAPSTNVSSSQKRGAESGPRKRPRHSPQPRNVQATPGMTAFRGNEE
ncbi:hypothetical protein JVU11DRAFT_3402 [Chiua virens]|nr:hypothetical protein JVU11DRAFT_3402 [Chiua virens]